MGILYNILNIPLDIFLDFLGPLGDNFCLIHCSLKNTIVVHQMCLLNYIILVKYLLIFVSKNPTEIMSNFWNFFLNILSLGLSSLSQIFYVLLPGRMPINFFICIGTDPKQFEDIPRKINFIMQFIGAICIV